MENNNNSDFNPQNVQPQAQPLDQQAVYGQQPQPAPYPQPEQYQQPQPAPYPQQDQYQQPQPAPYPQQDQYQQMYADPNMQYAQYPEPAYMIPNPYYHPQTAEELEEAKKRKMGNILCFISLGLYLLPELISGVTYGIMDKLTSLATSSQTMTEIITGILSILLGGSSIASWVLVIIARIKYKNTFSKVLLWIYAGLTVLSIIAIILIVILCVNTLRQCPG